MSYDTPQTTMQDTPPFLYDVAAMNHMLGNLLNNQLPAEAWQWLQEKAAALNELKSNALTIAFAAMPRKTGKGATQLTPPQAQELSSIRGGFTVQGWTLDRLGRVWLLLQLDAADREQYRRRIEQLFPAAELNELVALYSALPLLAYPEAWRGRCAEGIRSNIGPVLETIICNNPYPSEQLPEAAWNQLVLKAFFTEKRVDQIIGLDERANEDLAHTLLDFAHERWAAGRQAPPLLWRCVAPFLSEGSMPDLERAFFSENSLDRDAAALACAHTLFAPAKALLQQQPALQQAIQTGSLTWTSLAERTAMQLA